MKQDRFKKWIRSIRPLAKSLILIVLTLFVFFPFQVLTSGQEYWNSGLKLIAPFLAIGLVLIILILRFVRSEKFNTLTLIITTISVVLICNDFFSPVSSSLLDGQKVESLEPVNQTLIEVSLAIVILFGLYLLRRKLSQILNILIFLVLIFVGVSFAQQLWYSTSLLQVDTSEPGLTAINDQPNIYHLVLDEMQTDAFEMIATELGMKEKLDGFTWYENNRSNYLYTNASLPSFMTGTYFDPVEDYKDWQDSINSKGMAPYLDERGYNQSYYAAESFWVTKQADQISFTIKMLDELQLTYSQQWDFSAIFLAKVLPNFLTSEVFSNAERLRSNVGGELEEAGASGIYPYLSVKMFNKLLLEEKSRPNGNQYVFYHATLPHAPYIVDQECMLNQKMEGEEVDKYIAQATCGMKLITRLVEQLKKEGKYDNSMIVVHADTGHGNLGYLSRENGKISANVNEDDEKVMNSRWSHGWVDARTYALMMIKPPNNSGELEISSRITQLTDIFPTVAGLFGDKIEEVDGNDLFSDEELVPRRLFFWPSLNVPSHVVEYQINDEGKFEIVEIIQSS